MDIFKKKEKVIESVNTKEVEAAQVWMVSWNARYGEYSHSIKRVAKAFLNEDDADMFIESLKKAATLLQYTEGLSIQKTLQE